MTRADAYEMIPGTIPYEIIENWAQAGVEHANLNAAAAVLEETRKVVRAQYALQHAPSCKSQAAAEAAGEADPRYEEHVRKMVEARRVADVAKVHAEVARAEFERRRTNASTLREIGSSFVGKQRTS